jgi:general stress protein 26
MFDMSNKDNIVRVRDIIEKVGVCMLTTQFVGGLRARPLEARPDRDTDLIFFVTDIHSAKEDEIEATPDVGLVFIDPNDKAYLSITGRACVMRDADKIKAAWRKTDEVWWPGGAGRWSRTRRGLRRAPHNAMKTGRRKHYPPSRFDFAGSVLLAGSEAGKVPSRPLSSSLCNFLSDFTACFGSAAYLSVGAGLNFSDMVLLVSQG